jgi:hypothetical protein
VLLEIERGSTRSRCVENSLWKGLWTCLKAGYGMNKYEERFKIIYRNVQLKPLAAEFMEKGDLNPWRRSKPP